MALTETKVIDQITVTENGTVLYHVNLIANNK